MCNKTILSVLKQFFNKLSSELIVNGQRYLKGDRTIPLVLQDFFGGKICNYYAYDLSYVVI